MISTMHALAPTAKFYRNGELNEVLEALHYPAGGSTVLLPWAPLPRGSDDRVLISNLFIRPLSGGVP